MQLFRTKSVEQTIAETGEEGRKLKRNLTWWDLSIMGVAVAVGAGAAVAEPAGAGVSCPPVPCSASAVPKQPPSSSAPSSSASRRRAVPVANQFDRFMLPSPFAP